MIGWLILTTLLNVKSVSQLMGHQNRDRHVVHITVYSPGDKRSNAFKVKENYTLNQNSTLGRIGKISYQEKEYLIM